MTGRYILAALVAGIIAGLVAAMAHQWRVQPLIAQIELAEHEAHGHAGGHSHDGEHSHAVETTEATPTAGAAEAFTPIDSSAAERERLYGTVATYAFLGAGYALILLSLSLLSPHLISKANAVYYGLAGFFSAQLLTSFVIPVSLPGMEPLYDLPHQTLQLIWMLIAALAIFLARQVANRAKNLFILVPIAAACIYALPNFLPAAAEAPSFTLPAALVAQYTSTTLSFNFLFWLLTATLCGVLVDKVAAKSPLD